MTQREGRNETEGAGTTKTRKHGVAEGQWKTNGETPWRDGNVVCRMQEEVGDLALVFCHGFLYGHLVRDYMASHRQNCFRKSQKKRRQTSDLKNERQNEKERERERARLDKGERDRERERERWRDLEIEWQEVLCK